MASLIAVIAGLIMFLSFALIAGQMLLALSEAYIGLGGSVIRLGFSGSRWTIKFAENFIGWTVVAPTLSSPLPTGPSFSCF